MCGLVFTAGHPDRIACEQALESMRHRGPDDSRTHTEDDIFIGFNRLSILDLTDAAAQPIFSPDGRYVLAFNGEIYNYVELRKRLEGRGWPWRSDGDTEVLLALLVLEGSAALTELRGMFAFVLWDRERRSLLAARDPLGIKPLYYRHDSRQTTIASELRAMRVLGLGGQLDQRAVESFLLTGSVVGPRTILSGVRALPAGHLLEVEDGQAKESAFWSVPELPPTPGRSEDELVDELDWRLGESVRIQLRADVPVATFLSGGLDSSLVTSYAAEHMGTGVHTFSVGFEVGDALRWDETSAARLVSDHYGTDHERVVVTATDFERSMDDLVNAIDQPSVDGPNTYFVSQAAASSVTVALSGQGGDELFAGYHVFRFMSRLEALRRRLHLNGGGSRLAQLLLRAPPSIQHDWYALGVAGALSGGDVELLVASTRSLFSPREVGCAALVQRLAAPCDDPINAVSRLMLMGYLRDTLLRDTDAMSMRHSLEVRVPLVDPELASFALGIPGPDKVTWQRPKLLLRQLGERRLPPELLDRPKQGFSFPLPDWLAREGCLNRLREALAPDVVRDAGLVDPGLVSRELDRLARGRGGRLDWLRANRVWALFVLHEWDRRRMGSAPPRLGARTVSGS